MTRPSEEADRLVYSGTGSRSGSESFSRLLGILLMLFVVPALALGQSDIWLGGAGNWSNSAKWSTGVPTSSSNVFIDNSNAQASPVAMDIQGLASDLTIDSDDSLSFNNGTNLTISGNSISNAGVISLNSLGNLTYLFIANGANLTGAGTVTMSNNSQNAIDGNSGALLTNKSTIQGAGQIGPHFTLANQGIINANVSGAALLVNQQANAIDTNTATMEATNGGILQLATGGSSSINNAGGTIKAVGTGSQVQLSGQGTTISGGTLTTSSGGSIVVPAGTGVTLSGVTNAGTFSILNNSTVNLGGTIAISGTIQLNSAGSLTTLFTPSSATLTGAGTVTMSNNSQNAVDGNGGATLINQSTIQGVGQIGPHFTLANQGTINANVSGAALLVSQQSGAIDTNTATMEATNGGILQLATGGSSSINNGTGTIKAVGTGSQVQLSGQGTTISGGTLTTSSGGSIVVPAGTGVTLSGVTNAGTFSILNNATVNLNGTITNSGTINLNSTGGLTELFLPSTNVTLAGKGRVVLNNNPNSAIDGSGGLTLTNQSTIQGGGTIGPHFTFFNQGTLNVTAGKTLNINAPFANFNGSMLTGGAYTIGGTLEFTNANIITNAAKIILSGSNAKILNQSTVNALTGIASNTKGSMLSLVAGQVLTTSGDATTGAFTNAGTVKIGTGSAFQISPASPLTGSYKQSAGGTTVDGLLKVAVVQISAGTLLGEGMIVGSVTSSGSLTAGDSATKPGILAPSTYIQNSTGKLNIAIGGTTVGAQYGQLAVANGATLNGTLNIKLINGFVPAIGNSFTVVTASPVNGSFSTVNGLSINSGEHFMIAYNSNNVTLTAVSGP
ncbi:MAG TPA: hypothetical protein VF011_21380 [Terriglobales bacterium]